MPDISSLYGGYLKGSRFSRIKDTDLQRALKPYSIQLADIRKNKKASDVSLRRRAAGAVVSKYLKKKSGG